MDLGGQQKGLASLAGCSELGGEGSSSSIGSRARGAQSMNCSELCTWDARESQQGDTAGNRWYFTCGLWEETSLVWSRYRTACLCPSWGWSSEAWREESVCNRPLPHLPRVQGITEIVGI